MSDLIGHGLISCGAFGGSNWFRELLPKQCLSARTFIYEYPDTRNTLADGVSEAAKNLFREWERLDADYSSGFLIGSPSEDAARRSKRPSRPVVFVCLGLGGFVVKKVRTQRLCVPTELTSDRLCSGQKRKAKRRD